MGDAPRSFRTNGRYWAKLVRLIKRLAHANLLDLDIEALSFAAPSEEDPGFLSSLASSQALHSVKP